VRDSLVDRSSERALSKGALVDVGCLVDYSTSKEKIEKAAEYAYSEKCCEQKAAPDLEAPFDLCQRREQTLEDWRARSSFHAAALAHFEEGSMNKGATPFSKGASRGLHRRFE
jgi:hypothetical protein